MKVLTRALANLRYYENHGLKTSAENYTQQQQQQPEQQQQQHTFTHVSLINESSAALTNFPHPLLRPHALGQPVRKASALTHETGHVQLQIVNSEHMCSIEW